MASRTHPRVACTLLVAYALLLAVILLWPTSTVQAGLVTDLVRALARLGVPSSTATFTRAEVVMNAVIIAPITFLGSLVLPRLRWQDWTAYALLGATAVELFQGVALPHRQASFSDIVANSLGAALGALAALWWHRRYVRART